MHALNQPIIDLKLLRALTFKGIPCVLVQESNSSGAQSRLRALVWRVMLGALPLETAQWDNQMANNLDTYTIWKAELIKNVDYIQTMYKDDDSF